MIGQLPHIHNVLGAAPLVLGAAGSFLGTAASGQQELQHIVLLVDGQPGSSSQPEADVPIGTGLEDKIAVFADDFWPKRAKGKGDYSALKGVSNT